MGVPPRVPVDDVGPLVFRVRVLFRDGGPDSFLVRGLTSSSLPRLSSTYLLMLMQVDVHFVALSILWM